MATSYPQDQVKYHFVEYIRGSRDVLLCDERELFSAWTLMKLLNDEVRKYGRLVVVPVDHEEVAADLEKLLGKSVNVEEAVKLEMPGFTLTRIIAIVRI